MEVIIPNKDGKASGIVGILDLQVILAQEGPDSWVAQAIQIDYAAGGSSLEDAKTRFEKGFKATLQEHLSSFGNLKHFVVSAPAETWFDLITKFNGQVHLHSEVVVHELLPEMSECDSTFPFDTIKYFSVSRQPAMAH